MKKALASILSLAMMFSLLTACGGGEEAPPPEETGITDGYWVLDSMTMEGTEFTKEEIEQTFGSADQTMCLTFLPDQTYMGVLFMETIQGSYTETEAGYDMSLMDDKATVVMADGMLTVTVGESYIYKLVNQEEAPEVLASNPWLTFSPCFSPEETCAMSTFMNYGYYYIEDDVIYGLTHKGSNGSAFGAIPFYQKGDFPEFEEVTILDDTAYPSYVAKEGDYLYYILGGDSICRIKPDGSGKETLYEGECSDLQIHDGRLYFTDADYHFVSTDLDGKNLTTVVDKEIYYPYFICSDWMVYQDDANNEALCLYNTTFGFEEVISSESTHMPILDGTMLYYLVEIGEQYILCRIDLSNRESAEEERSENTLAFCALGIDEEDIYTANDTRVPKDEWTRLADSKEVLEDLTVYVSPGQAITFDYDEEGLISKKSLLNKGYIGLNSFY